MSTRADQIIPVPRASVATAGIRPLRWLGIGIGALVAIIGVIADPVNGWTGLLTAGMFGTSIAMGAALFIAINIVGGARWWDPIRATMVAVARTLPIPLVAVLITVVGGMTVLYPWARPGVMETNHLLHEKAAWLNAPFFIARAIIIAGLWMMMLQRIGLASGAVPMRPGATRPSPTGIAARFIVAFAATISVAYWDWTMSLEPEWFSTMYGVYGFAGSFQAGIAAVAIATARTEMTTDQRHCLGKLLFAFSMFWAYIWFCQYMLVWYADIPEEASHFATRLAGGWSSLFWLNPIVCFVVPFTVLLAEGPKQRPQALAQVAAVVLMGRWIDVFLLTAPPAGPLQDFPYYGAAASVAVVLAMWVTFDKVQRSMRETSDAEAARTAPARR